MAADLDITAALPELLRAATRRHTACHPRPRAAGHPASGRQPPRPDGLPLLRDSDSDPLLRRQADLLRRGQREGHLRADLDPYLLAVTYQGLVDTMLDSPHEHPDIDPDRYAEHTAAVLLDGVAEPTGRPSPTVVTAATTSEGHDMRFGTPARVRPTRPRPCGGHVENAAAAPSLPQT